MMEKADRHDWKGEGRHPSSAFSPKNLYAFLRGFERFHEAQEAKRAGDSTREQVDALSEVLQAYIDEKTKLREGWADMTVADARSAPWVFSITPNGGEWEHAVSGQTVSIVVPVSDAEQCLEDEKVITWLLWSYNQDVDDDHQVCVGATIEPVRTRQSYYALLYFKKKGK